MTYGNHDFENIDSNCTLTNDEIKISKIYDIKLELWQEVDFSTNTKIIFIDTSIYDDNKIKEYIECYKSVDNTYETIDIIKEKQNDFIKNVVKNIEQNPNINNIIIAGHHPLAYLKIKDKSKDTTKDTTKDTSKDTSKDITKDTTQDTYKDLKFEILSKHLNDLLFNDIYSQLKNRSNMNYYYLCADLHQYQSGNIEITNSINSDSMNIKQYIVGTGGAKLDPYNSKLITPNQEYEKLNIKYKMNEDDIINSCSENGFLQCIQDKNNIIFKFIKADTIGIPILRRLTSKKTKRNTLSSRPKSAYVTRSTRRSARKRRSKNSSYKLRIARSI
jgi:hypothetical protein